MAAELARVGADAVFSYAGRTADPVAQPLPMRVGGFGGVDGLRDYLRAEQITHVIDATHPFAAQMSWNAYHACKAEGVPLLSHERAPWVAGAGDRWQGVADMAGAVDALPDHGARVFLAIGKQTLTPFAAKGANHYLLRLVDPPGDLPFGNVSVEVARGPFDLAGDLALMRAHQITHVVAKNAGGTGAAAKLHAARALGLPVIMIERPETPERLRAETLADVMIWLDHQSARLGV